MCAKFAANIRKPDALTVLPPELAGAFVGRLRTRQLPGFGHSMSKRLKALHIDTGEDGNA